MAILTCLTNVNSDQTSGRRDEQKHFAWIVAKLDRACAHRHLMGRFCWRRGRKLAPPAPRDTGRFGASDKARNGTRHNSDHERFCSPARHGPSGKQMRSVGIFIHGPQFVRRPVGHGGARRRTLEPFRNRCAGLTPDCHRNPARWGTGPPARTHVQPYRLRFPNRSNSRPSHFRSDRTDCIVA